MELDLTFFAVAVPAVVFAGVSKGGFGSGAAFASVPLLAMVIDPRFALGLMLPLLMLADSALLRPYWGKWSLRDAGVLIAGGLPGVGLGVALYRVADADLFRLLIGALSLAFVAWELARRRGLIRPPRHAIGLPAGLLAGVLAGLTSFVSHAGGPPVSIYLLSKGLSKTVYQSTTVLVFWAINIAKAVPYAFLGIFTAETALANLVLAPAMLLGAWLGVRAHHIVPERAFFAIAYVLLTITGARLVWLGLA